VVVLYICNPTAGFEIAFLSEVVILGGRKPLLFEVISNFADGLGKLVPIPTFCPWV
jgi:hypothetical protein